MNKKELVESIVKEVEGVTKKDVDAIVEAFKKIVGETVATGEKVSLTGFGAFELRERAERKGKNPQTKEEITIPASKSVGFKVSKSLKEVVK